MEQKSKDKVKTLIHGKIEYHDKLPDGRFSYDAKNNLRIYKGVPKGALHHAGADGMDPMVSHLDNKTYDSRSAYMRSLKDAGYHIVDKGHRVKKKPIVDEKALEDVVCNVLKESNL